MWAPSGHATGTWPGPEDTSMVWLTEADPEPTHVLEVHDLAPVNPRC